MISLEDVFAKAEEAIEKVAAYLPLLSLSKQELFITDADDIKSLSVEACMPNISEAANALVVDHPYLVSDIEKQIRDNNVERDVFLKIDPAVNRIRTEVLDSDIIMVNEGKSEYGYDLVYYRPERAMWNALTGITADPGEYRAVLEKDYTDRTAWIDDQVESLWEEVEIGDVIPYSLAKRIMPRIISIPLGGAIIKNDLPESVLMINNIGAEIEITKSYHNFTISGGKLYHDGNLFTSPNRVFFSFAGGSSWISFYSLDGVMTICDKSANVKSWEVLDTTIKVVVIISPASVVYEEREAGTLPDGVYTIIRR